MKEIRAVIFDMDGLMLDSEKEYLAANQEVAREMGFDFTKEFYMSVIGSDNSVYEQGVYELLKQDRERADEFLKRTDQLIQKRFAAGHVNCKPGLRELLDYLTEEKITAVVASSTERQLVEMLLDKLELTRYFQAVIAGDDVHFAKPDPEIFQLAARATKCSAEEVLVLEDSLNGVRAADRAGLAVVMVPDLLAPDAEARAKATEILPNLTAVKEYIAEVNAK